MCNFQSGLNMAIVIVSFGVTVLFVIFGVMLIDKWVNK
jgi:hypothetical protein